MQIPQSTIVTIRSLKLGQEGAEGCKGPVVGVGRE